ncbi:uncharacterized protein [Primulina eburnea]|uniref:uncharacterized protein n=1 Tax=Primulina eburnea TaxID=1245227 RepID=UPI003C6C6551
MARTCGINLSVMAEVNRDIATFLAVHQHLSRSFIFLLLLTRFFTKFVSRSPRRYRRRDPSYNITGRIPGQINHLHRIIKLGDVQCVSNLRMDRNAFARLCYLVKNVSGVVDSRYVRIEEKVAMFLSILAHHKKVRVIGHDYVRSGQTVSCHFHEVLRAILKLHPILLVKPVPVDENCSNNTWKWFKGCLGALDGTYISVQVSNVDKAKYRNRKGTTSINVLGICNRDMQFIYALTGWEGSAADARVLRDAVNRQDGLKIPRGCYYLCDNGYPNVEGFLTPYRRTRYHMNQWVGGSFAPQNYKEFFNSKHCHARNVIERAFGLLKRRWAILCSPSFYPLKVHNRIVMACILLHNFIRSEMVDDPVDVFDDSSVELTETGDLDFIGNVESSPAWDTWRENLALSMYHSN